MKHNPFDPRDRRERFEAPDLTRRILERTSGDPCRRAELLLAARWDDPLDPVDAELLDAHLAGCEACRALARVMADIRPRLPELAERTPDAAFTTRVLAATTGVGGARPAPTPWLDRLAGRLAQLGRELWARPRFALEVAWTATAITAVLMWSPLAPERTPAAQAAEVVTAGAGAAPAVATWFEERLRSAEEAADDLLSPSAAEAAARLNALGTSAQEHGAGLWNAARDLLDDLFGTDDDDPASELATPEE